MSLMEEIMEIYKNMNKICTDIEQSKKLIELGFIDTADLSVTNLPIQNVERFFYIGSRLPSDTFPSITDGKSEKIPAWSLTTLFKMLPYSARIERGSSTELYCVTLPNELKSSDWYIEPIDAVFEMICWLKEKEFNEKCSLENLI